jgi:hypothetical protein
MADDDDRTREEPQGSQDDAQDSADSGDDPQAEKARQEEQEVEDAKRQMQEIEEGDPPERLEDWPGGKAKYQTYGGPEGEQGYDEAATEKLGPSSLRHHEDGSVSIEGEEVDDPEEYKGEPIPGGPSDPDAPPDPAMGGEEDDDMGDEDSDSDDSDADADADDPS